MAKVVYNACYGGFGLSRRAILRAREISGDPKWGHPSIAGDEYAPGKFFDRDYGNTDDKIERHDAVLVAVVEELGDEANGEYAKLRIEELPPKTAYRIDEYDGRESVVTQGMDNWKVAP